MIRLARREYGFFVEFDRGTVRPTALRAKFAAYVRYRAGGAPPVSSTAFRTCWWSANNPVGNDDVLQPLSAVAAGQPEPAVLFTTTALLAQGFFDAIWRVGGSARRLKWA